MQIYENKKSVYVRKGSTPTGLSGLVWNTNMAAISLFGDNNIAEVTSRENARGVLPSNKLTGMCRWKGSHFHN